MRLIFLIAAAGLASSTGAFAQSSNTSSNTSSNNGVTRERIDDRYCDRGYCERYVSRRTYRDDGRRWRDRDRRRVYAERYYERDDD